MPATLPLHATRRVRIIDHIRTAPLHEAAKFSQLGSIRLIRAGGRHQVPTLHGLPPGPGIVTVRAEQLNLLARETVKARISRIQVIQVFALVTESVKVTHAPTDRGWREPHRHVPQVRLHFRGWIIQIALQPDSEAKARSAFSAFHEPLILYPTAIASGLVHICHTRNAPFVLKLKLA